MTEQVSITCFRWPTFPFANKNFSILVIGDKEPDKIKLSKLIFYLLNLYPDKRFGPMENKLENLINLDYDQLLTLPEDAAKTVYINLYQIPDKEVIPYHELDKLFVKNIHLLMVSPSYKDIPLSWLPMFSLIIVQDIHHPEINELIKRMVPSFGSFSVVDKIPEGVVISNLSMTPSIYIYPEMSWNVV